MYALCRHPPVVVYDGPLVLDAGTNEQRTDILEDALVAGVELVHVHPWNADLNVSARRRGVLVDAVHELAVRDVVVLACVQDQQQQLVDSASRRITCSNTANFAAL